MTCIDERAGRSDVICGEGNISASENKAHFGFEPLRKSAAWVTCTSCWARCADCYNCAMNER